MTNTHGGSRKGAGRPPTQGGRHNVKLPDHIWQALGKNKSETIIRLVEDKMKKQYSEMDAHRRVDSSEILSAYNDQIFYDWADWADHINWVCTAPESEIVAWAKQIQEDEAQA